MTKCRVILDELDHDISQSATLFDPESLPDYGDSEYIEPNKSILIDGITLEDWLNG